MNKTKLQLCLYCDEWIDCSEPCDEALKFEDEDHSDNYSKKKYIPTNSICTWDALHNPGRQ